MKQQLEISTQAKHELKQKESEMAILIDKHAAELCSLEDRIRHEV